MFKQPNVHTELNSCLFVGMTLWVTEAFIPSWKHPNISTIHMHTLFVFKVASYPIYNVFGVNYPYHKNPRENGSYNAN